MTPKRRSRLKVLTPVIQPENEIRFQKAAPNVDLVACASPLDALEEVDDADAAIGLITQEICAKGKKLRWLQSLHAGVDRILFPELMREDLTLTNARDVWSDELAEHHLAYMFSFAKGLHILRDRQHEELWDRSHIAFSEIGRRTLLVIGFGGIGRATAHRADALGMKVDAITRTRRKKPRALRRLGSPDQLLEFLGRADYVAVSCALTPETRGLFNRAAFSAMKRTAYLTNVTRGEVIDTQALLEALSEGLIAGAGLDATDPEPLPPGHPLWHEPNVIVTPHSGGFSSKGSEQIVTLIEKNLRRFSQGKPLLNVVDKHRGY